MIIQLVNLGGGGVGGGLFRFFVFVFFLFLFFFSFCVVFATLSIIQTSLISHSDVSTVLYTNYNVLTYSNVITYKKNIHNATMRFL